MIKLSTKQIIEVQDWDDLVEQTYGKPYSFQQQWGCQDRGIVPISVVEGSMKDPYEETTNVEEAVNVNETAVSFQAWLARDPRQKLSDPEQQEDWYTKLWWERSFFPDVEVLANDMCNKGLIAPGEYSINIDW